ncbi:MAG: orotidine-5'-phosphate decarboxylase [Gammaproteobacteria bacterium]|nr:orotidine-5'-phosphate decarboxylase [Gammaproteobacteria bacterium]
MNQQSYLSTKAIATNERLIFALDVESNEAAKALVERLGDSVTFYKVGLELFMAGAYFEIVDWLLARNKKVFVDLKFFDVPQTVASAVSRLRNKGVEFATVHGNDAILKAASEAKGETLKILAVTVLTSLDRGDLEDLGFQCDPKELVLSRAKRALQLGCDGVISSGLEAPALRESLDHKLLVITPGIRPVANDDDQKRTVNVEQAFRNGADYIVVGRPIKLAENPHDAAMAIQHDISRIFADG